MNLQRGTSTHFDRRVNPIGGGHLGLSLMESELLYLRHFMAARAILRDSSKQNRGKIGVPSSEHVTIHAAEIADTVCTLNKIAHAVYVSGKYLSNLPSNRAYFQANLEVQ